MPRTYWKAKADDSVYADVERVIKAWHKDLADNKVKVGIIFAYDPKGPAVMHAGYPAYATVRILSLRDRVSKDYDVEVLIDAELWKSSEQAHKDAILDHEFSHVEVKRHKPKKKAKRRPEEDDFDTLGEDPPDVVETQEDEEDERGEVMLDDNGRPMLKTRKGDWNGGDGFKAVAARHGDFAIEVLNSDRVRAMIDSVVTPTTYRTVAADLAAAGIETMSPEQTAQSSAGAVDEVAKALGETEPFDQRNLPNSAFRDVHDPSEALGGNTPAEFLA